MSWEFASALYSGRLMSSNPSKFNLKAKSKMDPHLTQNPQWKVGEFGVFF